MPLTIASLHLYPVKSCAGIDVTAADLDQTGLRYDRRWAIVRVPRAEDLADPLAYELGDLVHAAATQRELPHMALIRAGLTADALTLDAPGMPPLRLPLAETPGPAIRFTLHGDTYEGQAVDAGADAALSAFLGAPVRLLRMADGYERVVNPERSPQRALTAFSDGYPLLLIGSASLDALNQRLIERGKAPVTMRRFRPNVVVTGGEPFAEDGWLRVLLDGLPFDVVKPCARCVMTTVDPLTGRIPDPHEPLATLATFRRAASGKVMFGQNLVHRGRGTLHVGAPVEVVA
ncbi:MAG: MOSC domain-containing protein [Candidatus Flexifilum sp.]